MAKNWKVGEAVAAIKAGEKEAIMDIGHRFPLFSVLAAQVNEAGVALLAVIPDYVTARKLEMGLKGDATDDGDESGEEKDDKDTTSKDKDKDASKDKAKDKDKDKAKDKAKDKDAKDPYEGKTAKELFTMCKEREIKVEPKKDAEIYLKALKKDDAAKAKAAAAKDSKKDDDDWGDDAKKDDKKDSKKDSKKDDDDWDI